MNSPFSEETHLNKNTLSVYKSDLAYFDKWINSRKVSLSTSLDELIQDFTAHEKLIHSNTAVSKRRVTVIKKYHPLFSKDESKITNTMNIHCENDFRKFLKNNHLKESTIDRYVYDFKRYIFDHTSLTFPDRPSFMVWFIKFLNDDMGLGYQNLYPDFFPDLSSQVITKNTDPKSDEIHHSTKPNTNSINNFNFSHFTTYLPFISRLSMAYVLLIFFFIIFGYLATYDLPKNSLSFVEDTLTKNNDFVISLSLKSSSSIFLNSATLKIYSDDESSKPISECRIKLPKQILDTEGVLISQSTKTCSIAFQNAFLTQNYLGIQLGNDPESYPRLQIRDLYNSSYFAFFAPAYDSLLEVDNTNIDELISIRRKEVGIETSVSIPPSQTPTPTLTPTLSSLVSITPTPSPSVTP